MAGPIHSHNYDDVSGYPGNSGIDDDTHSIHSNDSFSSIGDTHITNSHIDTGKTEGPKKTLSPRVKQALIISAIVLAVVAGIAMVAAGAVTGMLPLVGVGAALLVGGALAGVALALKAAKQKGAFRKIEESKFGQKMSKAGGKISHSFAKLKSKLTGGPPPMRRYPSNNSTNRK